MDNFVALILLFHGLSIGGLIWAIKASIRRAMFKRTMKTLNAAVQSIPPELYDAAGIALTAAGVPGGTAIAGGVKSLAGSLPNPEDPAAKKRANEEIDKILDLVSSAKLMIKNKMENPQNCLEKL